MREELRETLMEILEDIRPDLDFTTEDKLISGGILESFDIVSIVGDISDEFDIDIRSKYLVAENFDSAEAMLKLIEMLLDE